MTECIHGLDINQCGVCSGRSTVRHGVVDGAWVGKRFALIYAPSVHDGTFLHLNREGDHWKIRWYQSAHSPATELAQSGRASTRRVLDLETIEIVHEIDYPYSSSPGGVTVKDSRYWFGEIQRANDLHDIGTT